MDAPTRSLVALHGEHDISTAGALAATLAAAIASDDGADLDVDLSDVQFMDASAISVIVRARSYLARRHRSLSVSSPSPVALRLLDLCRLDDLVVPTPTRTVGREG